LPKKLEDIRKKVGYKPQAQANAKANPQPKANPKQQQPIQDGNKKNKKNTSNKQRQKQKAHKTWQKVPAKPGEPHTKKQINGKTWHWCDFHMFWTVYTPDECRKNPKNQEKLQASNANFTQKQDDDDGTTGLEQKMATLVISAGGTS